MLAQRLTELPNPAHSSHLRRFDQFELDLRTGEIYKQGKRIKLQEQPCQVLAVLIEHPGELVTREELKKKLWPNDTFVDFDHGVNLAVNKLRDALGDSAENPRFIETLPRRGYRFIGTISEWPSAAVKRIPPLVRGKLRIGVAVAVVTVVLLAALLGFNVGGLRQRMFAASAPTKIQSIAVLPLASLSGDPAQEYFSDGMTDALITDLAQLGALRVISRTSIMRYKKTEKPLPEIARELNVDAIVEGTVQHSGDRVRITAQLIHGPSDKHLWANSYDRELRDALQLQADVAQDIAEGISANLPGLSRKHSASGYSLNPDAYDDYLKGRSLVRRWTRNDVAKGLEFLERSIQRDPNYAPAYAELSFGYQGLTWFDHDPPGEVVPKGKAAAMKALALDENLAEAHTMLGLVYGGYEWDWASEERELRRAVQLDPNSSFAHSMYASYLVTVGRKTDAFRETGRALELDPFSPMQHSLASWVFFCARDYDAATREGRRAVEIDSSFAEGHLMLAGALGAKGKSPESFQESMKYLSLAGDRDLAQGLQSAAKRISGPGDPHPNLAHIALRYYQKKAKTQYVAAMTFAGAYLDLGDKERTLEWLAKAYQEHATELPVIAFYPAFDSLRSDPRFQNLLRRMNLPIDSASANMHYN